MQKSNLTPEQITLIKKEADKELSRRSLSHFLSYESKGQWKPAKHLDVLTSTLEKISNGQLKRVIVTMPPRHGKSEVVSKKFPAWHVGKHPEDEIIVASYSLDLSRDFSRLARETLKDNEEIFGVTVDRQRQSAESWGIEGHRGSVTAVGIGGPITGRGARIAIVDDSVKNAQEANSEVMRENIWEWYQSTLYTRLTPDGRIVIVMTRWHEDDLVGRLLKKEKEDIENGTHKGDKWVVINFPAIAEEEDYLGRKPGEPLWPEFGFDKDRMDQIKADVGSYVFNALYQQRPSAANGTIFKREHFRYFKEVDDYYDLGHKKVLKRDCWTFQMVDTANSIKTINDYFVVGTFIVTPNKELIIYDMFRTHIEGPDQKPLMKDMAKRYKPKFQAIENKTFGTNLIQECLREGMIILPVNVDTDKVTRSLPVAAKYETHTVYHRENAPWLTDFEDELLSFPRGKHDDQVDVVSGAGELLRFGIADKVKAKEPVTTQEKIQAQIKRMKIKSKKVELL